ncbi:PREDICTED: uncharacterized protein LOC106750434 isoform X3 [Dinoponera quadriceps]|uniref:Uncharacterized protein LOC106750434 isoform X3 n=1 Tax=Dinoponera quadriceps TaxID=609295 RepID=A0A6P3Y5N4_DINQU|nr:PREDICTED: uncharacterized protein LOC106750434 isoform X3 [Dinoponera quadriceps]
MKTQPFHLEVLAVLLLSVIPWPGPSVFKISCPRDRASVVRRIVHKRWMPILKKYQVELPLECPFHESRDIFRPQQKAKHQHRPSQWTCGLCGKSFYAERHLDAHFDNRHKSNVNTAEDAVCLADYCDIMRCDVLGTRDFENSVDDDSGHLSTDIQVWRENTEQQQRQQRQQHHQQRSTSVVPCESRGLARMYPADKSCAIAGGGAMTNLQRYCRRDDHGDGEMHNHRLARSSYHNEVAGPDNKSSACDGEEDEDEDDEDAEDEEENLVEAALPAVDKKQRRRGLHLRKLKSNCKPEELQKLKTQCEILVRDCIAGLLANLSVRDFQEIEGELNRAICWYLSCDKYWEDTKRQQRHTPWYLLTVFIVMLFSSIYACYYVIWVCFKTADEDRPDGTGSVDYNGSTDRSSTSPLHDPSLHGEGRLERRKGEHGDENLPLSSEDMPDHYIYVSYPPELKRRILERDSPAYSCYNRTTRL